MCSLESATVKSDYLMQKSLIDLMQTVGLLYQFTVCSGDIKKALKMTSQKSSENDQSKSSENDQLIFQMFPPPSPPPDPKSEKKSRKSTDKKILA